MNEANKWKILTSMETPRRWFGATAIGENIYYAGGFNCAERFLSSVEVYNSKLNEWSSLSDMKRKRDGCAVTSLNGNIYAVGGFDSRRRLSSCEMFDLVTNKWTPIPDMNVG